LGTTFFTTRNQPRRYAANVRFGSKADICSAKRHVRFTPNSGHLQRTSPCPLCAKSGHVPLTQFGPSSLLRSYNSDSSHLALLNQFNKADVRFVKSVVSHRGAGLSGFLTKPLIHRQPLFENRTPFAA
jgi:hypothetical protein